MKQLKLDWSEGHQLSLPHMSRAARCPVCGSVGAVDRPDLPRLQATCLDCRWHFTVARVPPLVAVHWLRDESAVAS